MVIESGGVGSISMNVVWKFSAPEIWQRPAPLPGALLFGAPRPERSQPLPTLIAVRVQRRAALGRALATPAYQGRGRRPTRRSQSRHCSQ